MDAREWLMTKHLKAHDKDLECRRSGLDGPYCVYQKGIAWDSYQLPNGTMFHYSRPVRHLVFSLTDTWTKTGKPVEWGIEPVISRIKEHRAERHEQLMKDLLDSYEKQKKSQERDQQNKTEAFLGEFKTQFARATNDINTSTLDKKIDSRRIKNGYL